MRYQICYLLLVSACLCERSTISNRSNGTKSLIKLIKHQHGNKTNNCKRLNCPTTEELKCIKLKNKNANNSKEIFIIVFNKCEIDYVKCHKGLEATLVPMENCDKPSIKEDSDKKRPKRSPNIATNTSKNKILVKSRRHKIPYKSNKIDYSKLYFGPQRRDNSKEDGVEGNPEERNESLNKEEVEEINISIEGNMGDGDEEMMSLNVMEEKDEIQSSEEPESNDGSNDDHQDIDGEDDADGDDDDDKGGDDNEASEINEDVDEEELKDSKSEETAELEDTTGFDDQDPKIEGVHIQYLPPEFGQAMGTSIEVVDRNKEIEPQNAKIDSSTEELDKVSVRGEKPDTPDSSDDSDINTQETQNSDCPTECPARDVMVCARCKAGVYRTFLSVCHLRLFTCNHPEEKLELVSRRPCILSAPFLPGMKTKGRQKDPNDEDVVLKYIRCREKGDNNDPMCKFAKVDKKDS